jgi:hypothetical protein
MSGNAAEMTSSWYGDYQANYKDPASNNNNQVTVRGGRAQRGATQTFQNCSRDAYKAGEATVSSGIEISRYVGFRFACYPDE